MERLTSIGRTDGVFGIYLKWFKYIANLFSVFGIVKGKRAAEQRHLVPSHLTRNNVIREIMHIKRNVESNVKLCPEEDDGMLRKYQPARRYGICEMNRNAYTISELK